MNDVSNIVIGIDIDDTIENLLDAWVAWLNNEYGFSVKPIDITEWSVPKFFPSLTREQVYAPLYINEFWDTVKIKPDALVYIKKLYDDGFPIYIVTNSNSETLAHKLNTIVYKNFPFIDNKHIIVTANKQIINLNILIDDNPDNLTDALYYGILFDAHHNQSFDCGRYNAYDSKCAYHNTIHRAMNWKEVYNKVYEYVSYMW